MGFDFRSMGFDFRNECRYCTDGMMECISCVGRGTRIDLLLGLTGRCRDCCGAGQLECVYC